MKEKIKKFFECRISKKSNNCFSNKKKLLILLILFVGLISLFSVSYSYFMTRIEGVPVTVKVGTLEYTIESDNLTDNQITLAANTSEVINFVITSNNSIDSKYQLFYKIISPEELASDLVAGYTVDSLDMPGGIMSGVDTNNIQIVFNNYDNTEVTIEVIFKVGLLTTEIEKANDEYAITDFIEQKYFAYSYSGNYETFKAPITGLYQVELWGAQGGSYNTTYTGGKGAYTKGSLLLTKDETFYIYVGEQGVNISNKKGTATYNGGGGAVTTSSNDNAGTGGGATDIRYFADYEPTAEELIWNSDLGLNSRIMVAGGGGGAYYHSSYIGKGGDGGTLVGGSPSSVKCTSRTFYVGTSATQTAGGTNTSCYTSYTKAVVGTFGIGATGSSWSSGGGGGYYGGGYSYATGGSGGSSYISGYEGSVAITSSTDKTPKEGCTDGTTEIGCSYHYSGKIFEVTEMIAGNAEMPSQDLMSTVTGNSSNGYARITFLSALSYNIVYDANGGEGEMENSSLPVGIKFNLKTNTFIRTGYKFLGWSTNASSITPDYLDGAEVTDLAAEGEIITLYAVWQKLSEYTVVFKSNGGLGEDVSQVCYQTVDCVLSVDNFSKTDYVIYGWLTDPANTDVTYIDGQIIKELDIEDGGTIILYAQWVKAEKQLALTFVRKAYYAYPGSAEGATYSHNLSSDGSGVDTIYTLLCSSNGAHRGWGTYTYTAISSETIDVTGYKYIKVDFSNISYGASTTSKIVRIQLLDTNGDDATAMATVESSDSSGTLVLDTSALSGSYYLTYYVKKGANANFDQEIYAKAKFAMPILTNYE